MTGESVGGQLSSEITAIRVPTLLHVGEGHVVHSVMSELWRDPAESKNLACVDAFCARIGRSVNPPVLKSWYGRTQQTKISWCIGWRSFLIQENKTNSERESRVGQGRSDSEILLHKGSRKSDNNIVPEKQANKRICRPQRSLWSGWRRTLTERNTMKDTIVATMNTGSGNYVVWSCWCAPKSRTG